jgi:hypothetical protein
MNIILWIFAYLSLMLWGTYIGAQKNSDTKSEGMPITQSGIIIGAIIFTLPVIGIAVTEDLDLLASGIGMAAGFAGFFSGLHVGRTKYYLK